MITVRVRYFNMLGTFTGCKEESLSFPSPVTLLELVHFISNKYPGGFAQVALIEGGLAPHLRIFVNNKPLGWQDGETIMNHGDEVMLFPAVAGG
jgi:MoaD family protein